MRNQFEYYGIKSTERREIQKPFFIKKLIIILEYHNIIIYLHFKPNNSICQKLIT